MKKKSNSIMLLWALILAVALSFSSAPDVMAAAGGKVKSVTVTNLPSKGLTLKKGKSKTLKIKVTSTNKKKVSQKVTCKSSAPKVASVTNTGKITAKKNGTAKITITSAANTKKKAVITVKVGTPVAKVVLNKASASVVAGKSITLKATVSPKNASTKNVIWSSSDPKTAKVNNKGKVTGVRAGRVNITATAADGSGAKKTIAVTVESAKVTVRSVSVVNDSTIKVSLSGTQRLAAADFSVKVKRLAKGRYNKQCRLDNIATSNQKDYLLVLDPSDQIHNRTNVQVTVTGLRGGNSSGTAVYNEKTFQYTDTDIYQATLNEAFNKVFYGKGIGYCAFTVDKLPKGIVKEDKKGYLELYGRPSQKGTFVSKITCIDEMGDTYTYSITWLIGSTDSLYAAAGPAYRLLGADGTVYINVPVTVTGGSGSYKYTLSGNTLGLRIGEEEEDDDDDDYGKGAIRGTLRAAGTYKIKVDVEDQKDPARKTTTQAVIYVAPSITISGIIKDTAGNPLSDPSVSFENKDRANKYAGYNSVNINKNGYFSATLAAGTYDIEAKKDLSDGTASHKYLYSQKLTTTRSGFDIQLPVRRILIGSSDHTQEIDDSLAWYDADGRAMGYGATLYLKDGSSHRLTAIKESKRKRIKAEVDFTVDASLGSVIAKVTSEDIPVTPIQLDVPIDVTYGNEYTYYAFKPAATGTYHFYSSQSTSDPYGCLEDADGNVLNSDDDGYQANDFYFTFDCTAGATYYVGIKHYSSGSGTARLYVSATAPGTDTPGEGNAESAAGITEETVIDDAAGASAENEDMTEDTAEEIVGSDTPADGISVGEEPTEAEAGAVGEDTAGVLEGEGTISENMAGAVSDDRIDSAM